MTNVDEAVENAWLRSRAGCECRCGSHHHENRCARKLLWESRGQEFQRGAWEAHQGTSLSVAVSQATEACEILCWECYTHFNTLPGYHRKSRPCAPPPSRRLHEKGPKAE
jgi:hypothetical protein